MGEYVTKDSGARESFETGMVRDIRTGKGRFDLITPIGLRRLAQVYERGAAKYADRNWESGSPFGRFLDSAERHINDYKAGLRDEDHLAQAAWNLMAIMHLEKTKPELQDLQSYLTVWEEPEPTITAIPAVDLGGGFSTVASPEPATIAATPSTFSELTKKLLKR